MKKALILFAAAVACAIAVPATAARYKTVKGSGNIVTETRNVGAFHAVEAGSIARVLVGDYPAGEVSVKADDNILAYVKIAVDNGKLSIGMTDVSVQNAELTVCVPASGVTQLETRGVASLSIETPLAGVTFVKAGGASKIAATNPLKGNDAVIESSSTARIAIESLSGTVARIAAGSASAIDLKGQPAGNDATIESSSTARIAVESLSGTVARIAAGGASKICLNGELTGRDVSILSSSTSRIVAKMPLVCDNATVECNGASDISIRIKCTDCRIKTSSTARTTAELNVATLDVKNSGAAKITLSGTASVCRIDAGGTSRIDATALKSKQWDTIIGKAASLKR